MSFDSSSLAISAPLQRALALAILVAVAGLIAFGIVLPAIESYAALEASIAESEAALARFDKAAERLPGLDQQQKALQQALQAQSGFLKGSNDSLLAAELQDRIKSAVERSGGELISTQTLPAHDETGLRHFTAHVQVLASTEQLERIWYEMESGVPFLFIDNFDIAARERPQPDRTQPPVILLDTRFDVSAFARSANP